MIEIENLTYRYNARKTLFRGLNLRLPPGRVYGLLGKNGAGKSSLIKNIAGFLFPSGGTCRVNGREPRHRAPAFLEQLFFIPEECDLPPLSLPELVRVYAPFYPSFNKAQFYHYLQLFHVAPDAHLAQLSFGQKKKAYISLALAANTPVLIMDEPTNGLDIPSKLQFRNIVAGASRQDKVTIMSTHQVRDLDDLIDAILIMDNSEVLLYAGKEEIGRKLYFETFAQVPAGLPVLYAEPAPNGTAVVARNEGQRSSYLDIEVLFNATLKHPELMQQLFSPPELIHQ